MRCAPFVAIAIFCLVESANAYAAAAPTRVVVLEGNTARTVHDALVQQNFNGAIVVEKDGALVLRAGYGWANLDRRIPFTTTTIAQIGSLTKQFTATVIADLWHGGRIDFQAPLSGYLDGVPPRAVRLTIEQLLTHTAGLPESGDRSIACSITW